METIYNNYKDGRIDLNDVYHQCRKHLYLSKEDALISACLTLITAHPIKYFLRKYDKVIDVWQNEPEIIYYMLSTDSSYLARKFVKMFGKQQLINPITFYAMFEL